MTHCGWSSIIEGLQFGRPLIMLPFVLDQGLNARVLAAKRVGVEIPRNDEDGSFSRSSVAESLRVVLEDEAGKILKGKSAYSHLNSASKKYPHPLVLGSLPPSLEVL